QTAIVVLRTFAFGLWSVGAMAGLDPEELAAALERYGRLPPRSAFAAAGMARLVAGLRQDGARLSLWRRGWMTPARDGRLVGRIGRMLAAADPRRATGFIQDALRRADALALALESRGLEA